MPSPVNSGSDRGVIAPYFCFFRAAWIPYAVRWDPETGVFEGVEGPQGFRDYARALEAAKFLWRP